ncbi:hypothetical protein AK812_SmicGene47920, partial [Symbiodinium microadriaticum]
APEPSPLPRRNKAPKGDVLKAEVQAWVPGRVEEWSGP